MACIIQICDNDFKPITSSRWHGGPWRYEKMHFIFLLLYFAEEYSIQKNKIHYNLRAHISVFVGRRHSAGTLEKKGQEKSTMLVLLRVERVDLL